MNKDEIDLISKQLGKVLMPARLEKNDGDKFRLIMDNNPHPMWIFDHETLRFREINHAATAKYGYSRDEFLKMKITDIRPPNDLPRLIALHKRFRMNRKHIGEWKHQLKNGRLIDVEITAYPLMFEGRAAVLVQAHDITERKQTQEKLRRLAVAEERNRIAREIHDTLAQAFTGILLQLEAACDVLPKGQKKAKEHITHARNLALQSLREARRSVWQLRSQPFQNGGLEAQIKNVVKQAKHDGVPVRALVKGKPRTLSPEIENNLLRISQEALTNVIKHAEASRVNLTLSYKRTEVQLILQDNGKGFDQKKRGDGFGLISMRERSNRIGAKLIVQSTPLKGSKLTVIVPV